MLRGALRSMSPDREPSIDDFIALKSCLGLGRNLTSEPSPGTRRFPVAALQEQTYPVPPGPEGKSFFWEDFANLEDALARWRAVAVLGGLIVGEGLLFGIFGALNYPFLAFFLLVILLILVAMIARSMALTELAYAFFGAIIVAIVLTAILALPPPTQLSIFLRVTWWSTMITEVIGTAVLLAGLARSMRISGRLEVEDGLPS